MRLQILSPKCPNCGNGLKLKKKMLEKGYLDIVKCPACRSDVMVIVDQKNNLLKEKVEAKPVSCCDAFLEGLFLRDKKKQEKTKLEKEEE